MEGNLILKKQGFIIITFFFLSLFMGCTQNNSKENKVDVLEKIVIPQETNTMIDMFETQTITSPHFVLDSLYISYNRFDPLRQCFHCGYLIKFVITIIDIDFYRKIQRSDYNINLFCENEYICEIQFQANAKEEKKMFFEITNESSSKLENYAALQNLVHCLRKGNLRLSTRLNPNDKIELMFIGKIPVKIIMW